MTPEQSTQRQIEAYRAMTGEARLLIGLRMHELSCAVSREGILHQFPEATPKDIEDRLRQRIRLAYAASARPGDSR